MDLAPVPEPTRGSGSARREYCTYFDLEYLDKGLALYQSLVEHAGDFRLHVVCFDDLAHRVLAAMELPHLDLLHVAELEAADPELLATRTTRSSVEYMWTATPCVIRFFRDRDGLGELTYLDADTCFFSSPEPLFDALGTGSVSITPASSSPQHYSRRLARQAGLYVVQFVTFRFDEGGNRALEWWRESCIEWCYARFEDERMGDQKYLDAWPLLFDGVRPLGHPGILGPWCMEARRVERQDEGITVDSEPLIVYHYMGLRIYADGRYRPAAGRFRIRPEEREWIYDPYLARLREARRQIAEIAPEFPVALIQREPLRWRLQAPVSKLIGALARARIRLLPHWNVGPYVPGGYVPRGYAADPEATARAASATYSASASESSG